MVTTTTRTGRAGAAGLARRARSAAGRTLCSLELTLACFGVLMTLVVGCTLAQGGLGTFQAVNVWMRSWFLWRDLPRVGFAVPIFPGGVLVGVALVVNLLAAQLSRLELSRRKAGIWLAHAGLVLLVAGEFVTGAFQRDLRLVLQEGQTASFAESPRELELAIVDAADPASGAGWTVPESRLARQGRVEPDGAPFSLRVERYARNAEFALRTPADGPPVATAGIGGGIAVREIPPVTSDDAQDRAAAFVEVLAGGRSLGTFFLSNALASPQSFALDGRTWEIALRPRREPLGFALTLKDFRHEVHPGTDVPRTFASLVHLSNRATGEERDVLVSMNEPLRYGGRAFYQASFGSDDRVSILQVVANPGWRIPYASAALVAAGLVLHFGLSLWRARRRAEAAAPSPAAGSSTSVARPWTSRAIPWALGAVALAGAASGLAPRSAAGGLDVEAFGRLPVLEAGRVKPIDSVARNALLAIHGRQSLRRDGRTMGAGEWLLDLAFRPAVADAQPVFFVDDPDVLGLVGRERSADRYLSARTLVPHLEEIRRQAEAARRLDARDRTRFQAAILNLFDRMVLYLRLRSTIQPPRSALGSEISAASTATAERHGALARLAWFRPLPPVAGGSADAWRSTGEALSAAAAGPLDPGLAAWARLSRAWARQDGASFAAAADELARAARVAAPSEARRASAEAAFNRAEPLYAAIVIYVAALVLLAISLLWRPALLSPAATGLVAAGAIVHTAGLACRMALQGRPPVTNLYSSAVFVGWAAVVLALAVERSQRRGAGTAVGASAGAASLVVAHHLTGTGDTLEMMRAVLDSNFWLATHVVAITIGYAGTFVAGALALGYAARRHLARPDPERSRALAATIHGVVCFSLLFSFVGTVLGGIWADQSWGRFWGWDPKENGALLIVLWNAAILHARLAGLVREKGLAAMAILGNVVTSLSWFGVNMLGVGLHSYGFMAGAFPLLLGFGASQVVLAALTLAPPRLRRARAAAPETPRAALSEPSAG